MNTLEKEKKEVDTFFEEKKESIKKLVKKDGVGGSMYTIASILTDHFEMTCRCDNTQLGKMELFEAELIKR